MAVNEIHTLVNTYRYVFSDDDIEDINAQIESFNAPDPDIEWLDLIESVSVESGNLIMKVENLLNNEIKIVSDQLRANCAD